MTINTVYKVFFCVDLLTVTMHYASISQGPWKQGWGGGLGTAPPNSILHVHASLWEEKFLSAASPTLVAAPFFQTVFCPCFVSRYSAVSMTKPGMVRSSLKRARKNFT